MSSLLITAVAWPNTVTVGSGVAAVVAVAAEPVSTIYVPFLLGSSLKVWSVVVRPSIAASHAVLPA